MAAAISMVVAFDGGGRSELMLVGGCGGYGCMGVGTVLLSEGGLWQLRDREFQEGVFRGKGRVDAAVTYDDEARIIDDERRSAAGRGPKARGRGLLGLLPGIGRRRRRGVGLQGPESAGGEWRGKYGGRGRGGEGWRGGVGGSRAALLDDDALRPTADGGGGCSGGGAGLL